nr:MAG TPA: hypothetical protein [Caudoviricetes sp.]
MQDTPPCRAQRKAPHMAGLFCFLHSIKRETS